MFCFVLQRTPTNENNSGAEWQGIQQFKLLLPVCLRDFSAVERKDSIVCCLRLMLKLSRENKSAAAPIIYARSNDTPCTRADFPAKKALRCFEDQEVHVIAALFINCFHQLVFIYFLEKIRSRLLGETELSS